MCTIGVETEMKSKKLGKTSPYFFEDNLIISMSKDWIGVFRKIPEFEVMIDSKGRLVLIGPTIPSKTVPKNSLSEQKILEVLV